MKDAAAAVRQVAPGLFLVALDQPNLPGFNDFIGTWVLTGPPAILVDAGPAASVPALVRTLADLGIRRLDAILLTHIHIDHAGGAGDLCRIFPHAPVICHRSAHRHLADPTKLWQGSLETLGDTARAYGPIAPVPVERLMDAQTFNDSGVETIPTPGHAPHHVSFRIGPWLFAGEAGGVFGDCRGRIYLRPATPPRFFLQTTLESIDRLMGIDHELLCYGHFGWTRAGRLLLETHRRQLLDWAAIIRAENDRVASGTDPVAHCLEKLRAGDPLLAPLADLDAAVRVREEDLLKNSIRGFIGYLRESAQL